MFTLFLVLFNVLAVLVLAYVLIGRAWIKKQPWAYGLFKIIEPIEITLWEKSETILWSRLLMVLGAVPFVLDQVSLLNMPEVLALLPPKAANLAPLIFTLIGIISEFLRRGTTKPLSLVSVVDNPSQAVSEALEIASTAKQAAIETVEEHK